MRRLDTADDLTAFDCGVPALDEWLRRFALADQRAGSSVTYVLALGSRVVGFYTIAPHAIEAKETPTRLRMGQPSGRPVPVLLLARLGLDRSEQGHGIGAALLRDALTRSAAAADEIGGRAVVVHAKNATAAGFYRRFGFTPLPGNPHHLVLLVKDIRKSIRATSDAAG